MLPGMGDDARYLNFGAGTPAPGWMNLDSSPWFALPRGLHRVLAAGGNARPRAFCDAPYAYFRYWPGRRLPFDDAALEAIYCSHVLEHLPTGHVQPLLDEFKRVLAPGGRLRLIVPDLEANLRDLLASDAPFASLDAHLGTLPEVLTGSGFPHAEGEHGRASVPASRGHAHPPPHPNPLPEGEGAPGRASVPASRGHAYAPLPPGLRTRIRAAMEGFFGFPSCHRTAYFRGPFSAHLEPDWEVETGLTFRESAIDPARIEAVEQASRCEHALVWELTRR